MPTDEEIEALIAAAEAAVAASMAGPAKVSGDAGSVETHSIDDQLKYLQHLRSQRTGLGSRGGLRFVQLIPPGTT